MKTSFSKTNPDSAQRSKPGQVTTIGSMRLEIQPSLIRLATLACTVTLFAHLGNIRAQVSGEAASLFPPDAQPFGQSMGDWAKQWTALENQSSLPKVVGPVLLATCTTGSTTGSGTLDDPQVFTGQGNLTVAAGTALFTPLLGWTCDIYTNGNVDPVPPDSWWGTYWRLDEDVLLDGQTVITATNINKYFVPNQYYDPPLLYRKPTSAGAIGSQSGEGWWLMTQPLAVGVHTLSAASSWRFPANNGLYPEQGGGFRVTYIVTVIDQLPKLDPLPRLDVDGWHIFLKGPAGISVKLQFSSDLKTWTKLLKLTLTGGVDEFTDTNTTSQARYYRIVAP